jgi:trimeric autotransporter adhesin
MSLGFATGTSSAAQIITSAEAQASTNSENKDIPRGGRIHGSVKAGTVPLSGVIVAATNRQSGKKVVTITDGAGMYSFVVSQDGRYLVLAEFPDLTSSAKDILLDGTSRDQQVNFSFRNGPMRQQTTNSLSSLWTPLLLPPISISTLSLQPAASNLGGNGGGQFPSFPGDLQFSGDTFAVNGQAPIVNPYFQLADQMRQDFEDGHQL